MKPTTFDFKIFKRESTPNNYLVCPADFCSAHIDEISPVFDVNVSTLEKAWLKIIAEQPRIEKIAMNRDEFTWQYVQRSFLFRFPDIINVQLIPINSNQSTLAIYSRAVYGYYDFNVNKRRVKMLLAELHRAAH